MNTELRLRPHAFRPGQAIVEIWINGAFVGEITTISAEHGGVQVISKMPMSVVHRSGGGTAVDPDVVAVWINTRSGGAVG